VARNTRPVDRPLIVAGDDGRRIQPAPGPDPDAHSGRGDFSRWGGFAKLNAISFALTLAAVVFVIASLLTITVVPKLLSFLDLPGISEIVNYARWPALLGRTNKTAVLGPALTDPSWPVPAADRVNVRESLFAEAFNRLLQQNRHETDMPKRSLDVCC
jgi:hypothetical protein